MASNADLVCLGPVNRGGRPTDYNDETAADICELLAQGLSLTIICANDDMPNITTVYRWLRKYPGFCNDYARARASQADTFADQIQDISDNPFIPVPMKAQMIDARKWRAARQNWRAWGDKVQHEHTATIHAANGAEQLPAGLGWLAGQLPNPQATAGSEPDDSGVGEE